MADITNFDPQQFSFVNFPLIKNLYDSLLEYTPDGKAVPSLATAWQIAPDNTSVTVTLRKDVKFHSGAPFNAEAVAANLKKAADPQKGKNVYATMSFVKDWTVVDPQHHPAELQRPGARAADHRPAAVHHHHRSRRHRHGRRPSPPAPAPTRSPSAWSGQRIRLAANPNYWRENEPVTKEVVLTIFTDDAAATAALESGAVDLIYGGTARSAVRLKSAGYQLIQGPGPLVQVFRINSTRGPFQNAKFRQAFNYLMDREGILRVGYAGLGEVVALPWAPASPAFDKSYNAALRLRHRQGEGAARGLRPLGRRDERLEAPGERRRPARRSRISQVAQAALGRAGINIQLDLKQGAEFTDALLGRQVRRHLRRHRQRPEVPDAGVATNSIYRTANNPVLGTPHPHPGLRRGDRAGEHGRSARAPEVKAAYDNLNKVLVETAFGIPTNTYDYGPDRRGEERRRASRSTSTTCSSPARSGSSLDEADGRSRSSSGSA